MTKVMTSEDFNVIAKLEAKPTKEELIEMINEMEEALVCLESRLCKAKSIKPGRKDQVLDILKSSGPITVAAIATRLGISARNVSSQMTYLRKDGHDIATTSTGKKVLL